MAIQTKSCVSLALGAGSVLAFAPVMCGTKLFQLSELTTPSTNQNIKNYWQNVGGYLGQSVKKMSEQYGK